MHPARAYALQAIADLRRTAAAVVELYDASSYGQEVGAAAAVQALPARIRALIFRSSCALTALATEECHLEKPRADVGEEGGRHNEVISTPPHWYELEHCRALIAAYLTRERGGDRALLVREFVEQFRGLRGSIGASRS